MLLDTARSRKNLACATSGIRLASISYAPVSKVSASSPRSSNLKGRRALNTRRCPGGTGFANAAQTVLSNRRPSLLDAPGSALTCSKLPEPLKTTCPSSSLVKILLKVRSPNTSFHGVEISDSRFPNTVIRKGSSLNSDEVIIFIASCAISQSLACPVPILRLPVFCAHTSSAFLPSWIALQTVHQGARDWPRPSASASAEVETHRPQSANRCARTGHRRVSPGRGRRQPYSGPPTPFSSPKHVSKQGPAPEARQRAAQSPAIGHADVALSVAGNRKPSAVAKQPNFPVMPAGIVFPCQLRFPASKQPARPYAESMPTRVKPARARVRRPLYYKRNRP